MECTVMQRQLRWVGHVIKMSSNRLPRRVLDGQLTHGEWLPWGPKKCIRFSDHLKAILKICHISFDQLEVLAMDRTMWRDACQVGLSAYMTDLNQAWDLQRNSKWSMLCHMQQSLCFWLRSSKWSPNFPKSQNIVGQLLHLIDGQLQGKARHNVM